MNKKISWLEVVLIFCLIIIVIFNYQQGIKYFEIIYDRVFPPTYTEFEYIVEIKVLLRKHFNIRKNYLVIMDNIENGDGSEEELKNSLQEIRIAFVDNKKDFEAIRPCRDYINVHKDLLGLCKSAIDSTDICLESFYMEDEEIKLENLKNEQTKYRPQQIRIR